MGEERLTGAAVGLLDAAAVAIDRLDWEEVDALASEALDLDPDNHEAATLLALAERHLGRDAMLSRRQATALFADLVGSTVLAEQLDVEAYSEVLRAYVEACRPVIERLGGYVVDVKGDGIVACFGYPEAHEDDPWRAVTAALEMFAALEPVSDRLRTEPGVDLKMRIGIDTGLVLVDGSGTVRGAAMNRAARLQEVAGPGTVVISRATNELVTDRFDTRPLGARTLKGVAVRVDVFRVVRSRDAWHGLRADPSSVPFVGRRPELDRILELWDGTVAAHRLDARAPSAGAMVFVTGDPGIGKSRLVRAVIERTAGSGAPPRTGGSGAGGSATRRAGTPIELYCSAYGVTSTLFPLRNGLERYTGIRPDDTEEQRLVKLEAELGVLDLDLADVLPFLGVLLELDMGDRYVAPKLAPIQLREAMLHRLMTLLAAIGSLTPVVIIIEDLHWADPTTLELLTRVTSNGVPTGLLVIGTARTGLEWHPDPEHAVRIHLDPLPDEDARELALAAAPGPVSERDAQEIVARGDGVPLFVEQLAQAVGSPTPAEGEAAMPRTLTQLLQARLDAVGSSRLVAQVAATIGREFDTAILKSVVAGLAGGSTSAPDAALVDVHLARLKDACLVEPMDGGEGWLRFRHVLMRDAAYESQLIADRSARHAAAAQALAEAQVTDQALIAFHYDRSGRPIEALSHYLLAVRRVQRAGAFAEVFAHLARCEELLGAVGDETTRNQFELTVRLTRGLAISSTSGYAAPGAVEDFGRARELCELLHDVPGIGSELLKSLFGVWSYYLAGGDLDTAQSVSSAIERQLDRAVIPAGRPSLDACRGVEAFYQGDLARARELLTRAVAGLREDDVDPAEWPLPNDPVAAACAFLGPLRFLTGDPAGGLQAIREGVERSATLEFPWGPFSLAFVRTYEALLQRWRGDATGAVAAAEDVLRIGEQYGFFDWQMVGRMHLAAARAMTETSSGALDDMGEAIAAWVKVGGEALIPSLLVEQAAGYLERRELAKAGACLEDALAIVDRGQRLPLAEGLRLRAELAALTDAAAGERVKADLLESIRVARAQGAVSTVVRAALTFRRLVDPDGRDASVAAALAEAVATYPGPETFPGLEEARSTLAAGARHVNAG